MSLQEAPPRGRHAIVNTWTETRITELKRLWDAGVSCSQIAADMGGISRNAVIGKVHRMGFGRRRTLTRCVKAPRSRRHLTGIIRLPDSRYEPEAPVFTDAMIPQAQRVYDFLSLENCHCRWPVGEPSTAEFFYCGDPTADIWNGKVYCAAHQTRSRTKPGTSRPTAHRFRQNGWGNG